jgi:hypothetical protein
LYIGLSYLKVENESYSYPYEKHHAALDGQITRHSRNDEERQEEE